MDSKYGKHFAIFLFLLLLSISLPAQEVSEVALNRPRGILDWALENVVIITGLGIVILSFGAIVYLNNMLLEIQKVRLLQEHGVEVLKEVKLIAKESWWKRWYKNMTRAVPIEKEADVMLHHDYDGIRELDNVLPPWWVALFYATIFIGVAYVGYYHVFGYGLSSSEEYALEMEQANEAIQVHLAKQANRVDETNVEALLQESDLMLGQEIFQSKCTPCHGQAGEGNSIGPNLTDEYWLNGGDIKNIFKTIKYGVPEKGMIAWQTQLRAIDMHQVASYILSLQGTDPPNAKEPQGELWKSPMPADSSVVIGLR